MARPKTVPDKKPSRELLLEAAFDLIRSQGFGATTVDAICERAGVSKGTFFHNFKSKEDLGVEAANHWSKVTSELFAGAPYHGKKDPLERFLGYVRFRKEILKGELAEFTCLVGTMIQEVYASHPGVNRACFDSISRHAGNLVKDIEEAKKVHAPKDKWSPRSLALHTQAVLQGAFILAKASADRGLAVESIEHLENYIRLLFKK